MRTRDDAAYGQRPAGARPSADDPLAELARLIGQEDPFAEFFRENADAVGHGAHNAAPAARTARPAGHAPRPSHGEPMRQEPARHDPVRQEPVRQEPSRHEPSRQEPTRHEAVRHEPPRQEPPRSAPGPFSALAVETYAEPTPRQSEPRGRVEPSDYAGAPRPGSRTARDSDGPRPIERGARISDRAAEAVAEALFAPTSQPAPAPVARTQPATPARDTQVGREAAAREAAVSRTAPPAAPAFDAPAGNITARSTGRPETGRAEPQSRGGYTLDDDAYDYGRTAYERDGYEGEASDDADDNYDYEAYEEERPPRSRRLALLGTAVGCAILLIAGGYFGLRAMSGGGTSVATGQTPVIKADQGPNKVAPPQPTGGEQTADGQKLIYDRVGGDPSGNERVVSSQEEPVDPSQAAQPQPAQPRVILPPTGGSGPAPSPSAPAPLGAMPSATPPQAQPQPSSAPANPTEPKRVRTLTVRADGTVVDGSSAPVLQPPGAPITPAPSAQAAAPMTAPTQVSSYAPDDAASSSSMPANVPLPPTRVAAAPVATPAAAPAAPAAADQGAAGGYFVQVAAQRTQGEAQSAWRATQTKFPGILGNYSANIRRADLGDRGIYYRAQVGPFNSKDQANELCQSLRAQGGDCMVQRN